MRRVADIERGSLTAIRWILPLLLPLAALVAGIVVWVARQRD